MGRSSRLVDDPRLVNEAEGIYLKDSEFLVREIPNEWERRNAVFNLIAIYAKRYAAGERLTRPPSIVCGLDLPNWSKFVEANLERSFSGERVYKDDKLKCNLSLLSRDLWLMLDMRERASQYFGKAITESVMFAELKKQVLMAAKLDSPRCNLGLLS